MNYTLNQYESLILGNGRSYFDYLSYEFNNANINNTLLNLALYQDAGGCLHQLISKYRNSKSEEHVITIKDSLITLLNFLRQEVLISGLESIYNEKLTESQLIELLSVELKNRVECDYLSGNKKMTIRTGGYDPIMLTKNKTMDEVEKSIIWGEYYEQIDLNIEKRPTLINENPWLDLVNDIEGNIYIPYSENVLKTDKRVLDEFNSRASEIFKYHTEVLPEPFLGNVLDAKVVILALNPGFVYDANIGKWEKASEAEKENFIKSKCDQLSLKTKEFISEDKIENEIGDNYWSKKTKYISDNYPNSKNDIALIQFCGYHSEKFRLISSKYFGRSSLYLSSQEFTFRIIRYLMQKDRVIILARGERIWYKAITGLCKYPKLVKLKNYRNICITPGNCVNNGFELIDKALR